MKTFLYAVFCVICVSAYAEESRRVESVRRGMEFYGWSTKEVTFSENIEQGQQVLIKRSGEVVGYYYQEIVWERRDFVEPALDGVTKIVFGYDGSFVPSLFQIEDKAEIAVWIAAYKNHTELERRFSCFVPTDKNAGFELKRDESHFGEGCLCSLALRFFVGDKEVLRLKGDLQTRENFESGMRNLLLHELVVAKIPKDPVKLPTVDEKSLIDPFEGR